MRDFKLTYEEAVGFDIDIINGTPVYVDTEGQTYDQRAAVGATIIQGTIPGNTDFGVGWSKLYDKEVSYIDINNDVMKVIQDVAGGQGAAASQYLPLFQPHQDGSVIVKVVRSGGAQ